MTIHGHSVSGDPEAMTYLKQLDPEEARVLFEYAKRHGVANFEAKEGGTRTNYQLAYRAGVYEVVEEGKEKSSSWF